MTPALEHSADRAPRHSVERLVMPDYPSDPGLLLHRNSRIERFFNSCQIVL
jgi:hypothetical protein